MDGCTTHFSEYIIGILWVSYACVVRNTCPTGVGSAEAEKYTAQTAVPYTWLCATLYHVVVRTINSNVCQRTVLHLTVINLLPVTTAVVGMSFYQDRQTHSIMLLYVLLIVLHLTVINLLPVTTAVLGMSFYQDRQNTEAGTVAREDDSPRCEQHETPRGIGWAGGDEREDL